MHDAAGASVLIRAVLGGETGAELVLGKQVLAGVARAASRQDVLDPVRAAAREWQSVILFERSDHAAVVARVVAFDNERLPFVGGEEALRTLTQSTVLLTL